MPSGCGWEKVPRGKKLRADPESGGQPSALNEWDDKETK